MHDAIRERLEQLRREQGQGRRERPALRLPLHPFTTPPPPRPEEAKDAPERGVVVIIGGEESDDDNGICIIQM